MRRLEDFAAWIRSLAEPVLAGTPMVRANDVTESERSAYITAFADEAGHRRAVDRPLLCRLMRVRAEPPGKMASTDVALWWSLVAGAPLPRLRAGGSLTLEGNEPVIETATEMELCALHALRHFADEETFAARAEVLRGQFADAAAVRARCRECLAWLIEHLQPDNATNHPWAVHVFAEAGIEDAEAALYAQTLVSNSISQMGRPDRFSACILLDVARAISGKF
jgi:hypothetical protein